MGCQRGAPSLEHLDGKPASSLLVQRFHYRGERALAESFYEFVVRVKTI